MGTAPEAGMGTEACANIGVVTGAGAGTPAGVCADVEGAGTGARFAGEGANTGMPAGAGTGGVPGAGVGARRGTVAGAGTGAVLGTGAGAIGEGVTAAC